MKILLAEDTTDLSRAVCAVLAHEGYEPDPVYDGEEALEHIAGSGYDCIVLDIMMPKKDGIQVLTEIRLQNILTPVLMLTAKAEVEDRVAGLDSGADDYLTKPFAMKELLARIRALTRRRSSYSPENISYGDLSLKGESFELSCENTVRLSVKEFELMQLLITQAGRQLGASAILERVWGSEPDADEDTVRLYISYLKRKLEAVSSQAVIREEPTGEFRLVMNVRPE